MGNLVSKKKIDLVSVEFQYPTKFKLDLDKVNDLQNGYRIYKFKLPKKHKKVLTSFNVKINFRDIFFLRSYQVHFDNLKRVIIDNKTFYESEIQDINNAIVFYRFNHNFEIKYVLIEISHNELKNKIK